MISIHGSFAIFRTQTPDGKDAILLLPEPVGEVLTYVNGNDEPAEISFKDVTGGEGDSKSYLTLEFDHAEVQLGSYKPTIT